MNKKITGLLSAPLKYQPVIVAVRLYRSTQKLTVDFIVCTKIPRHKI